MKRGRRLRRDLGMMMIDSNSFGNDVWMYRGASRALAKYLGRDRREGEFGWRVGKELDGRRT